MNTYHAAYWSSDPSRLSSSDEEEEDRDNGIGKFTPFWKEGEIEGGEREELSEKRPWLKQLFAVWVFFFIWFLLGSRLADASGDN